MRHVVIAAALLTLSGCCTLMPKTYADYDRCRDPNKYAVGWTHEYVGAWTVAKAPPRCQEAVEAALAAAPTCNGTLPHGVVRWNQSPFFCSMNQKVWGCSTLGKTYASVDVALPPSGHAADSAFPEEVAHWVWARCHPETVLVEEWRIDPFTGKQVYWRDPAFKAWYQGVIAASKASCQ